MTLDELQKLKELCEKATPGPWTSESEFGPDGEVYSAEPFLRAEDHRGAAGMRHSAHVGSSTSCPVVARTAMPPRCPTTIDASDTVRAIWRGSASIRGRRLIVSGNSEPGKLEQHHWQEIANAPSCSPRRWSAR